MDEKNKVIHLTNPNIGETEILSVHEIVPSPFQYREYFDDRTLKELAANIELDGLVEPIVVRRQHGSYELIAGERRLRAVRDFSDQESILARISTDSDLLKLFETMCQRFGFLKSLP